MRKQAEELEWNKSSSDDLRKKHESTRAEFEDLKKQVALLEATQEETQQEKEELCQEKEKMSEELKVVWRAKLSLEEQVQLNRSKERDWGEEMERLKREVQMKSEEARKEIELMEASAEERREESEVSLNKLKEKYSILRRSSEENVRCLQVKEIENELMIKTHNDQVNELVFIHCLILFKKKIYISVRELF